MERNAESDSADLQKAGETLSTILENLSRFLDLSVKLIKDSDHPMNAASNLWIKDVYDVAKLTGRIWAQHRIVKQLPSNLFENWRTLSKDQRAEYFFSMNKKTLSNENHSTL